MEYYPFENINKQTGRMEDIARHLSMISQNYRPEIFDRKYLELTKRILESQYNYPGFYDILGFNPIKNEVLCRNNIGKS